jgi:hypothetical protein
MHNAATPFTSDHIMLTDPPIVALNSPLLREDYSDEEIAGGVHRAEIDAWLQFLRRFCLPWFSE